MAAVHINSACFCIHRDKKKKKGDADAESGGESPGSPGDDADVTPEEVVWMTDTSEQAAKERAQQQLTKATASMVTQARVTFHIVESSQFALGVSRHLCVIWWLCSISFPQSVATQIAV